ncbi:hypothetical protein V2J09_005093 [Rumex salicifolius]
MDRRETMPMSGSSYYMPRGMPEMHPQHQHGIRQLQNSNMPFQPNVGGHQAGTGLVVEPTPSIPTEPNVGGGGGPSTGPPSSGVAVRRKRGRPRKYGLDGAVSLALSSSPANTPRGLNTTNATPPAKRGRGRPPGTGRKQRQIPDGVGKLWVYTSLEPKEYQAIQGNWMPSLTGAGFTPHVITIAAGEDIAGKIMTFARQGHRAVCVMAVSGTVSSVTLCQASSGGTITYEGRFDILHMSGSLVVTGNDGSHSRSGGLSISLVSPDGRVIGGGVGGMLIAASPVQVILGSFVGGNSKSKQKMVRREGGGGGEGAGEEMDQRIGDTNPASLQQQQQQQSQTPTSSSMGGAWPSPQAVEMHNSHFDIDLMRG